MRNEYYFPKAKLNPYIKKVGICPDCSGFEKAIIDKIPKNPHCTFSRIWRLEVTD